MFDGPGKFSGQEQFSATLIQKELCKTAATIQWETAVPETHLLKLYIAYLGTIQYAARRFIYCAMP